MSAATTTLPVLAHLQLTDAGRRRLDEVCAFLDELDAREHPLARRARAELVEKLLYLEGYGGTVSETDSRRRFQVLLGADLYPRSFTVTWKILDRSGSYVVCMNGGLVWHGRPGDAGSVCLEAGVLWEVHS